jgi:uncharacterized protein YaeQ
MALKPTIYKIKVDLSNTDLGHYDSYPLTIALHPSETQERMMARVLAFCINAQDGLTFTRGLNAIEEPAIWSHSLDGQISLWIDVGEPRSDRIKKSSRLASRVRIYSFNAKSDVWWRQEIKQKVNPKTSVFQFDWACIQALALLLERTMTMAVIITDNSAYIATGKGECEVSWIELQSL